MNFLSLDDYLVLLDIMISYYLAFKSAIFNQITMPC